MLHLKLQPDLEAQLAQSRGLPIERIVEAHSIPPAGDPSIVARAVARIRQLRKGNRLDGLKIKELINDGRKY